MPGERTQPRPRRRPATGAAGDVSRRPPGGASGAAIPGPGAARRRGRGGRRAGGLGGQRPTGSARTVAADLRGQHERQPGVRADGGGGSAVRGFFDASRQAFFWGRAEVQLGESNGPISRTSRRWPISCTCCVTYTGAPGRSAPTRRGVGGSSRHGCGACWQGRVGEVLSESAAWQERLGRPPPEADEQDPRRVVKDVERVFVEQPGADGLPALPADGLAGDQQLGGVAGGGIQRAGEGSGQVLESVGGRGGDSPGGAAVLSEDGRLTRYFAERRGNPYRRRQPVP